MGVNTISASLDVVGEENQPVPCIIGLLGVVSRLVVQLFTEIIVYISIIFIEKINQWFLI